jgi:hypothetical protein
VASAVGNLTYFQYLLERRNIYWNVHTTAYPAGEIRGEVAGRCH